MNASVLDRLGRVLSRVDRPGSFCASGSVPAVLPGLEVEGLGPVGLPLGPKRVPELIQRCEPAPYGKGEKTLVDPSVRRVWRMKPGRFTLTNPDWTPFLQEIVGRVLTELGLEGQELESHLYELLLYEPGGFFLPHRDGEKLDRMVATLVIVLPSSYKGGELVVRHDGQERTIDFGARENPFHIHFAAFYADCEHEIRPLRQGHRLCLIYNLTLAKSRKKQSLAAPRDSDHIETAASLLREWAEDDSARKLAITLDHQYTQDGLTWDALKGVDRVKARVLREAARRVGCEVHLALLTLWESGSAESDDDGYGYRYGGGYESRDPGDYEMGEIYETRLSADHWMDSEGHALPIGELTLDEAEVLDRESLTEVDPEEDVEGYTGNEGLTLDRWYRHAAIILWPERRHFEIISERDSRNAIPVLKRIVTRWQRSKGAGAADLKAQGIDLATTILAKWPANQQGELEVQKSRASDLVDSLSDLEASALIGEFLGGVLVKDETADPGESLVPLCQEWGWESFQPALQSLMKGTTAGTLERNVRLLEQFCRARPRKKPGWRELCALLAEELVTALEAVDRKPAPPSWSWTPRKLDRVEVLAGLARALLATHQSERLSRLVTHALATPKKYPLTDVHLPALVSLRPWLKKQVKGPSTALTQWVDSCREQLEARTAQMPQEPADLGRAAHFGCNCPDCTELKRFLRDPRERIHPFRVREDRRRHLEEKVREHKLDLDLKTERRGSPHTLICTKNTASYRERLKVYHQDLDHLETVRSIQASLPN